MRRDSPPPRKGRGLYFAQHAPLVLGAIVCSIESSVVVMYAVFDIINLGGKEGITFVA